MTYQETIQWLFSQLPLYQNDGKSAYKEDLSNSIALSKHLGGPEHQFKSIHVAGTNGKGSTSHMIASILHEAGYQVGLYTSPHLKDFRERIKINGKCISKKSIVQFTKKNQLFFKKHQLSFFEMTVGMAFQYFADKKVDFAVVEVGLGGRLDSTNIITPEVSVITNISIDHTQFLGTTLPSIAFEKAGIIKAGVPVVLGKKQDEVFEVFQKIAKNKNTQISIASENIKKKHESSLKGSYQQENIKTAVQTICVLSNTHTPIAEKSIQLGLQNVVKNTGLLGRWQILQQQPTIICDTAHNAAGLQTVMQQLKQESFKQLHIVMGMVNDKNTAHLLKFFPKNAVYYFCKPNLPRGLNTVLLKEEATKLQLKGNSYSSVSEAFKAAKSHSSIDDLIFVGGSTFVVAEIL